jgi:uncharacterized membrane protein
VFDRVVNRLRRWRDAIVEAHPALIITVVAAAAFSLLFGWLGVRHHGNYGTWSYDMGIYDQGFWQVSRGRNFMTVRGLNFWGHHLNAVVVAFVPFYWLGAGPSFLYVVQAGALGAGAIPVYLIARDRFARQWLPLLFVFSYVMYAPIQWISWANFHPEALVVTPMLFAWWFATGRRWTAMFVSVAIVLSIREDAALAMIMFGGVVLYRNWMQRHRRGMMMGGAVALAGVVWYALATQLVIPYFNDWGAPFYVDAFYGNYGSSMPEVVKNIIKRPDRVLSDAAKPDRLRFYRDLTLPLAGLPVLALGPLLVLAPQMLASVITTTPYARQIKWQYTSVMIAPLLVASIEGAWLVWRFQVVRKVLPVYMVCSAWISNVAWSPSPISKHYAVWSGSNGDNPRRATLDEAVRLVPDGASVTATYTLLPHLSQRQEVYDWPNPFRPGYWGDLTTCANLPSPTTVDYLVVDRSGVGAVDQPMLEQMLVPGGAFDVLLDADNVVVARRVGTDPAVDLAPQLAACPDR